MRICKRGETKKGLSIFLPNLFVIVRFFTFILKVSHIHANHNQCIQRASGKLAQNHYFYKVTSDECSSGENINRYRV